LHLWRTKLVSVQRSAISHQQTGRQPCAGTPGLVGAAGLPGCSPRAGWSLTA